MSGMRDAKHGGPALCLSVSILIWMENDGKWWARMRLNSDVQYAKLGPFTTDGDAMRGVAEKMKVWKQ